MCNVYLTAGNWQRMAWTLEQAANVAMTYLSMEADWTVAEVYLPTFALRSRGLARFWPPVLLLG